MSACVHGMLHSLVSDVLKHKTQSSSNCGGGPRLYRELTAAKFDPPDRSDSTTETLGPTEIHLYPRCALAKRAV